MDKYSDIVSMWRGWGIASPEDLDYRLHSFRILFAYNSGRIENPEVTYNDTREIFENGRIVGFTGSPRSVFEQQNQKLCYEYLKPLIVARAPLNAELVLETHAALTNGTYDEARYILRGERPGTFKKHDYVTGRAEVGSPPEQVEADISELLEEIGQFRGKDTLLAAAYFHAGFEYIHPFADGNGRVGRTLMNYFLLTHNHPPLIIYDKHKSAYYNALEQYDMNEEISPLRDFLQCETVSTWEKTLERETQRQVGTERINLRKRTEDTKALIAQQKQIKPGALTKPRDRE